MTEELFAVGDVVRFHRGEFSHVALYIGRGNIIHLWSPASAFSVRIDSIRHVQNCQRHVASAEDAAGDESDASMPQQYTREMDAKMLRDHRAEPFGGDEIVRRARTRLGESQYDYLSYNCEHFVTWARYGVGASPQARSHTNQVLAGALLGAAVGGIAGLVVGGAISLFSKMTALSASSSGMGVDELSVREVEEEEDEEEVSASEDEGGGARQQRRRDERERLLESIAAIQLEEDGTPGEFEAWAASRQQGRTKATARTYSEERHNALAARLADDKLLCGCVWRDTGAGLWESDS
jgi:hypothetical protein